MALSKTPPLFDSKSGFSNRIWIQRTIFSKFWATIWYRLVGWLAGGVPPLREATFSYPRPAHYAHELAYIFRCPHIFDSTATTLVFDREFLQKPIVRDRAELKRFLSGSVGIHDRPRRRVQHRPTSAGSASCRTCSAAELSASAGSSPSTDDDRANHAPAIA